MPTEQDSLSLLRAKYRERIRAAKEELEKLERKYALIDELEVESKSIKSTPPGARHKGLYASTKLTPAVLDAAKRLGRTTPGQVKVYLLENGFRPQGKLMNFPISVAMALKRLHQQGRLQTELKNGKRVYWDAGPNAHVPFVIAM